MEKNVECIVLWQQFNYEGQPAATNLAVFTYIEEAF